MNIREELEHLINLAVDAARADQSLILDNAPAACLERPRDAAHGDWASTLAMRCAKQARRNPYEIAELIVKHLPESDLISEVSVAKPGFINVRLSHAALHSILASVRAEGDAFGKSTAPEYAACVNLEYVSANPTGPMHVGHGRWAALGDSLARIMRHAGYTVTEEFYINDHGVQMDVFGRSVSIRYEQLLGHDIPMPEQSYGGSYVSDIAQSIIDRDGTMWLSVEETQRCKIFREMAYRDMLANMKTVLERFGTNFDCWFSERSLYEVDDDGINAVERAIQQLSEQGYVYDKDGARWFRSTAFGDEKDRVLVKANGDLTYFASDIAYHYHKVQRGFNKLIDIWGADHHGYVKRCEAMLAALGHEGILEVVLGQLVNLYRDGDVVRMSKRTGEMITFEELIDEVGADATRFLMLSRSSDQTIDFDIEVAKKKDASNPVYYVQYAHARICSILRRAACNADATASCVGNLSLDELAKRVIGEQTDLSPLVHPSELSLMRTMDNFGELVALAARDRAPFRLTHYAQELAGEFHQFYTNCHVLAADDDLRRARLALADGTRIVLALTLKLLGVSAPAEM